MTPPRASSHCDLLSRVRVPTTTPVRGATPQTHTLASEPSVASGASFTSQARGQERPAPGTINTAKPTFAYRRRGPTCAEGLSGVGVGVNVRVEVAPTTTVGLVLICGDNAFISTRGVVLALLWRGVYAVVS